MNNNTTRAPKVNIWWKMYVGDFASDTAHLSNEEIGIYVQILNYLWRNKCELPVDLKRIAKIVGITPRKLSTVLENLNHLITINGEKLHCDWLSEQYAHAEKVSQTNSLNAKNGWDKRRKRNANAMRPHKIYDATASNSHREYSHRESESESKSESEGLPVVRGSSATKEVGGDS